MNPVEEVEGILQLLALKQELFDCSTDELYAGTGGKKGERATLPTPAQEAYIVNETISKHRLNHTEYSGNQKQKDNSIVEDVRETAEHVRKWFPW